MVQYATKDADGNPPTPEPEVVKAVKDEIKKLGDNTKANYDELRKAHEALKKLIDEKGTSIDAETKSQITKLSESITTRQEEMDSKVAAAKEAISTEVDKKLNEFATKRIDALETAMKRLPGEMPGSKELTAAAEKEARAFAVLKLMPESYEIDSITKQCEQILVELAEGEKSK